MGNETQLPRGFPKVRQCFFLSLLLLSKTKRNWVEGLCPVVSLPQPKPWSFWPCHPLAPHLRAWSWLTETQKYVWNSLRGEPPASLPSLVASGSVNIGLERGVAHGWPGGGCAGGHHHRGQRTRWLFEAWGCEAFRSEPTPGSWFLPMVFAWARAAGTS